jgi:hypothetical protein
MDTKNTSINLPVDLLDWLKEQATKRHSTLSRTAADFLKERMDSHAPGIVNDIEWILNNRLPNYCMWFPDIPADTNDVIAAFTIERKATQEETDFMRDYAKEAYISLHPKQPQLAQSFAEVNEIHGVAACRILVATQTRHKLMRLFTAAIMDRDESAMETILVVPYKLDPRHKIWNSVRKQDRLQICTPDGLLHAILSTVPSAVRVKTASASAVIKISGSATAKVTKANKMTRDAIIEIERALERRNGGKLTVPIDFPYSRETRMEIILNELGVGIDQQIQVPPEELDQIQAMREYSMADKAIELQEDVEWAEDPEGKQKEMLARDRALAEYSITQVAKKDKEEKDMHAAENDLAETNEAETDST